MQEEHAALPEPLLALLDGNSLEEKIGATILITAVDTAGWPRMAILSVGEVLAGMDRSLRMVMYSASRTTQAIRDSRRALLVAVVDGAVHKISCEVGEVAAPAGHDEGSHAWFHGRVVGVDQDRVGYATVLHGLEYALHDPAPALERWREQVRALADTEQ